MNKNIHLGIICILTMLSICSVTNTAQAQLQKSNYCGLENLQWNAVRRLGKPCMQKPRSIQIPLAIPFRRDMAFMSPGFLICQAPVNTSKNQSKSNIRKINFLLGNPLFLPEPRRSSFTHIEYGLPAYRQNFLVRDVLYSLETCVPPADDDGEVCIRFTVKNESQETDYPAVVGIHVGYPNENEVANNNNDYNVLNIDTEHMPFDSNVDYSDGDFILKGKRIASISAKGWEMKYYKEFTQAPDIYKKEIMFGTHHQVLRTMQQFRVFKAKNILRLETNLKRGESKTFEMVFSINGQSDKKPDFSSALKACKDYYAKLKFASAEFGDPKLDSVWKNLQVSNYLLMRDKKDGYLHACQGHSTRDKLWTCEANDMMYGFSQLGLFEPVKPISDLIFSWQDNSNPPEGKFTTTKGAIGATGPAWANSTGAALILASNYIALSGDKKYFYKIKDKMISAANWILGEVEATRRNPELPYCGLMPPGRATDEDIGCSFPVNTISYAGIKALLDLDEMNTDPSYAKMKESADIYKRDILSRMSQNIAPDGSIEPLIKSVGGKIFKKFYRLNQSTILGYNAVEESNPMIKRHVEAIEKSAQGFSLAAMDRDTSYVSWAEYFLHEYYLKTSQYKKAWVAFKFLIDYGMSPDLHLTLERVSYVEPLFAPFQPNGSANSRILVMMKRNLLFDYVSDKGDKCLVILGGVPPFDFEDFPRLGFDKLPTSLGNANLKVDNGRLELTWTRTSSDILRIRLPAHFIFEPDSSDIKSDDDGAWLVPASKKKLIGKISLK